MLRPSREAILVTCGLAIGTLGVHQAPAQTERLWSAAEVGRPFVSCYSPEEFGGHVQSWAFLQDERGVLYVGNGLGVLEFDGSTWRVIHTANRQFVRSLSMDAEGRIYVGSAGELGYLASDALGRTQYVSLLQHVAEEHRAFSYVWSTHATPEGVYYQSLERLFRFRPDGDSWSVDTWEPTGQFAYSFWLHDTLYVNQGGVGMMKMVNDSLQMLPGGEQFADERIHVLLPQGDGSERGGSGKLIIGTFTKGLYLYDGSSIRPWDVEASDYFRSRTPYSATILRDGSFGIGVLNGGFVQMTPDGRIARGIDASAGLPSSSVLAVSTDREGGVWLSPENGICRIETPSPLSVFDPSLGLTDMVYDMIRHDGALYVATTNGVLVLNDATGRFEPVRGLASGNRQTWKLVSLEDALLVATGEGVYEIRGLQARPVRHNTGGLTYASLSLHRSRKNPDRLFVGLFDGLASLLRGPDGNWIDEGSVADIRGYIARILEPEPGEIWLASPSDPPLRLTFSDDSAHPDAIEVIGEPYGIAAGGAGDLFAAAGGLFFVDQNGVYRYDRELDQFEVDTLLSGVGHREKLEYVIQDDAEGNLWANLGQETVFLRRQPDGSFARERTAALRFFDKPAVTIYPESSGVVWFGTALGIIRYDQGVEKDYSSPFATMVRHVLAGEDTISVTGMSRAALAAASAMTPRLSFDRNSLRFAYAAPSLDRPRETLYQSMLDGFDVRWSEWSKEAFRVYTNLPSGAYTFRVRARNVYGVESSEARYAFAILPPWYRTWWAYVLYLLAAAAGVGMVVRTRTQQLLVRSRELEEVVETRTHELREQKENVEVLSRIGRDITASLDFDTIFNRLYENVNRLLDAPIFGVGIYHPEQEVIEYRLAVERGKRYAPYTRDMRDKNQLPVWCIEHREPVLIRDFEREYTRYIESAEKEGKLLEDGSVSEQPRSLMYLPLTAKERVLGVLTVQSFEKDAYGEYEMSILKTLAAYASVALDNAYAYRRLNETLDHLRAVQQQLIHQEKLASLGSMTAGIAHEIKNPLNFVNNFAALSVELVEEIEEILDGKALGLDAEPRTQLKSALSDLRLNCSKIDEHGRRANGIVKSMLEHSRGAAADRRAVDVNTLVDEYLNLAFHGMRAQDVNFNCTIERGLGADAGACEMAPQEIGRVLINLLNNAFYAVSARKAQENGAYEPTIRAATRSVRGGVEICIWDNGGGIPKQVRDRIFEPFFTTKPTGEGTGLGLSLSYEIVTQGHGGQMEVQCQEGESTEFRLLLPRTSERSFTAPASSTAAAVSL